MNKQEALVGVLIILKSRIPVISHMLLRNYMLTLVRKLHNTCGK